LPRAGLAAENITAGLNPKDPPVNQHATTPFGQSSSSQTSGEGLPRGYFRSPPPSANTTPAATSSALCVLMMDRNPPPLRPLTT